MDKLSTFFDGNYFYLGRNTKIDWNCGGLVLSIQATAKRWNFSHSSLSTPLQKTTYTQARQTNDYSTITTTPVLINRGIRCGSPRCVSTPLQMHVKCMHCSNLHSYQHTCTCIIIINLTMQQVTSTIRLTIMKSTCTCILQISYSSIKPQFHKHQVGCLVAVSNGLNASTLYRQSMQSPYPIVNMKKLQIFRCVCTEHAYCSVSEHQNI